MADINIPSDLETWMKSVDWGAHHLEWHTIRRYYFWHELAEQGNTGAQETVEYIKEMGWKPAPYQEGAPNAGIDFLGMHRAMILLIIQKFPQHANIVKGWLTPPTDPSDPNDPVPSGETFSSDKQAGVTIIEKDPDFFSSEDKFGTFVEVVS